MFESVSTGVPIVRDIEDLPELRRTEGFSDGAFAIIITLLVLEIHRPTATLGMLGQIRLDWFGWSILSALATEGARFRLQVAASRRTSTYGIFP